MEFQVSSLQAPNWLMPLCLDWARKPAQLARLVAGLRPHGLLTSGGAALSPNNFCVLTGRLGNIRSPGRNSSLFAGMHCVFLGSARPHPRQMQCTKALLMANQLCLVLELNLFHCMRFGLQYVCKHKCGLAAHVPTAYLLCYRAEWCNLVDRQPARDADVRTRR